MKTTIEEKNGTLVAIFEGRLDTAASVQTAKDMEPLNDCNGKTILCRADEADRYQSLADIDRPEVRAMVNPAV